MIHVKRGIIRIIFLIITVVVCQMACILLMPKNEHGTKQTRSIYFQPKNSIDVAFLGSSHIHCNINTAMLWEEYGITGYDYSGADQPLWVTYYYLKELCKRQNPKVVVLDLFSPAQLKEDYQYDWLPQNLNGVRFSYNKIRMIMDAVQPDAIGQFLPSVSSYHTRYSELTEEDYEEAFLSFADKSELSSFKGYTPYFNIELQSEPFVTESMAMGLTDKSKLYLEKIMEYCDENEIELFFIVAPYITKFEEDVVYAQIKDLVKDTKVKYNNFNFEYKNMGFDFATDFNDYSHLNYSGSLKFTKYLADNYLSEYDLPDHRGDAYYSSWDEHVNKIQERVDPFGF